MSFVRSNPHSHYSNMFELPDDYEKLYSQRDDDYDVSWVMLPK